MGAKIEMGNLQKSAASASKLKDIEANGSQQDEEKVSVLQAASHLFKGSVGAGLFAMGDCFKNGGLAGATLLMPIIAVIVVHCERMLIDGSVMAVEKTPGAIYFDYPDTVQKCFDYGPKRFKKFSKPMRLIVEVFLCVTQFGFCAIFFAFITKNVHQVLLQCGFSFNEYTVALMTLLPALIPSLMTNLKLIAPVSLLASLSMLFGVFATLGIAITDGPLPAASERHWFTNQAQMALCFGTAQFAFEGIALILPLRNSMRNPEKFITRFGVLNVTIAFVTILFIFTGSISYIRWGEDVQGIMTLNLNSRHIFPQAVKIVSALGVFFGYPIQFMILIKTIWPSIVYSHGCVEQNPITLEVLFRFVMVLMTFGTALVVPKLGLIISLIGALCSTSLALVIPILIDFVTRAQTPEGLNLYIVVKNSLILLISVLGIVTGTYQSLIDIIESMKH